MPDLILFLPGLTTSTRADLLRGRGLGLDLAEDAVRRLGGTIHLRSVESGGLAATLEVPSDQSLVDVLWLRECGDDYAVAARGGGGELVRERDLGAGP